MTNQTTGTEHRDHPLDPDGSTSRTFIAAMQVSVDGYSFEGDGDWVDSWADGLDLLPPVDAFLLGGGMFGGYEEFWGAVLAEPSTVAGWLGRHVYPREIAYARRAAETPHLVLSTTLTDTSWPTARIVRDISAIRTFKRHPGGAVYVVGGPRLLTSLVDAGLLDQLHLLVHPVVVGVRTSVFDGLANAQALELVTAKSAPAGRVHLTYRLPAHAAAD